MNELPMITLKTRICLKHVCFDSFSDTNTSNQRFSKNSFQFVIRCKGSSDFSSESIPSCIFHHFSYQSITVRIICVKTKQLRSFLSLQLIAARSIQIKGFSQYRCYLPAYNFIYQNS